MKQIFYFLIVLSLISFPLRYSYADCPDPSGSFTPPAGWDAYYDQYILLGVFPDGTCLNKNGKNRLQVFSDYIAANPSTPGWSVFYSATFTQGGVSYSVTMKQTTTPSVKNKVIYTVVGTPCSGQCGDDGQSIDTDNDGIPDDCDIYPDDPTPYKIRTVSFQTGENTFTGTKTYQWIQTDRGQSYELGIKIDTKTDYLTYTSPWENPPNTCSGENKDPENPEPFAQENPQTTNAPTGNPSTTNQDPTFQPGSLSDGTETGDALMRDIKDNTGKTATNTDRLGDYVRDLIISAQGMDRSLIQLKSGNQDLKDTLKSGNQDLKDTLKSGNQGLKDTLNSGNQSLRDAIGSESDGIKDTINSGNQGLRDAIGSGNQGLTDTLNSGFGSIKDALGSGTGGSGGGSGSGSVRDSVDSGFQGLKDMITERDAANNTEAQGHKSAAETWNPLNHYSQEVYNGTLTEGEDGDYQKPRNLSEETWFSSFVSSNPLVEALNDSGFRTSGSSCDMTLNLGLLGTHHLSLCEFQSEFTMVGNLLFAFCGLTSLIIIVRG